MYCARNCVLVRVRLCANLLCANARCFDGLRLTRGLPDAKRDDVAVLGSVFDVHRAAADFAVLDVRLLPDGWIQEYGDLLPAIRARERALL